MSRIETTCPSCYARITLPTSDVLVWTAPTGMPLLVLVCPRCAGPTAQPMSDQQADALSVLGASVDGANVDPGDGQPGGYPERRPDPAAPTLTRADLLEFHELLDTHDWFDRVDAAGDHPDQP